MLLPQKRLNMRQAIVSCVVTGRFLPCIVNLEVINIEKTEAKTLGSGLFPMIDCVQRDVKYVALFRSVFIGVSSFIRGSADVSC
jgi:hypothetical protein